MVITPEETSFIKKSTNLFNKDKVRLGYSVSSTDGTDVVNSNQSVSDYFEIKPSFAYIVGGNDTSCRWAFYDENKVFISTNTTLSFTSPANAKYAKLVIKILKLNTAQLNEGTIVLPYELYYLKLIKEIEIPLVPDEKQVLITYTNGVLNKVEEKDGNIVMRSNALNYGTNGRLISVIETIDGQSVQSTLNYIGDTLTSVSRVTV